MANESAFRNRSAAATLLAGGFVNYHTLAFKQTVYIGMVLLLALALGREDIALFFAFFAFLGCVYVVFLI